LFYIGANNGRMRKKTYYSGLPQDMVSLAAGDYLLTLVSPDIQAGAEYYA
jgi:hypothetical protein